MYRNKLICALRNLQNGALIKLMLNQEFQTILNTLNPEIDNSAENLEALYQRGRQLIVNAVFVATE